MINQRPATNEEMLAHYERFNKVSYRHFTREIYNPRAKNGVSHRKYSKAKVHNISGVPHVTYQGKLHPIRATYYTLDSGKTFVANAALDSPYLPN